ncbi:MAG: PaaI family thioesterase [Candidatus Hydrogenedentes bacterium]|nr:PaaI family thioesterase [Candidatus Hydrogenedentota bacterium]
MPLDIKSHHCGYPEVVHGGIVAAALDECMAWAATRAIGRMCVTGKLTIRYLDRTPAIAGLLVRASTSKFSKRLAYTKAELVDGNAKVYARATGTFTPISVEETLNIDDNLLYHGNEERVFAPLRDILLDNNEQE